MFQDIDSIQTVGIMNAMKTGNVVIDMIIAMLIPVVIGSFLSSVTLLKERLVEIEWTSLFTEQKKIYERFLKHSTLRSVYSTTDLGSGDCQNEILIKAIHLYLDHHGLLQLKKAELDLKQINEETKSYYNNYYDTSNSFADTLSKYRIIKKPIHGVWLNVGSYSSASSCEDDDINNDVYLMITEDKKNIDDNSGSSSSLKHSHEITLHFTSEGIESIDTFINTAYNWYLGQLRSLEDDTRYLYELMNTTSSTKDNDDTDSRRRYKRYPLSDDKTFDTLFFKEKESILKVIDNFTSRTGKYAIKGYPNKFGLLLHGPPGTGKTSLIKALAQKTGRSIVNVPLARITTNAELAALFFDQKYYIDGEGVPVELSFKDIIFVMEDIDAVGKVVRRRDEKSQSDKVKVEIPNTKSLWTMLLTSHNDDSKELVQMLLKKSDRLEQAAKDANLLTNLAQKIGSIPGLNIVGESNNDEISSLIASEAIKDADKILSEYNTIDNFIGNHAKSLKQMIESGAEINEEFENTLLGINSDSISTGSFVSLRNSGHCNKSDDSFTDFSLKSSNSSDFLESIEAMNLDIDSKVEFVGQGKMMGIGPMNATSSWRAKKDELNLSGLLNVLDGVVDTPGRMIVMTTNHPEMLDPALIRPGRIDKKLLLSYVRYEDLVSMIEHYFQTKLNNTQINRLSKATQDPPALRLSPASVEQMACEFDHVNDMINEIEKKTFATHFRNKVT